MQNLKFNSIHNGDLIGDELRQLQHKIQKGDTVAFTRLYSILFKRLYGFSFSIVKVADLAHEVVEDVLLKLWMQREKINAIQNLSVYLYVAVKNQSLNKLASKASQWLNEDFDEMTPEIAAIHNDPLRLMITKEMLAKINEAIENLPPRCKMIFKLVREDGLRYKEVAEILNISVNTIDVQMATAVKRICESLGLSHKQPSALFSGKK
ncbi:RNA polymerase sigma-70 factor [Niabella sp. W65]|nr:RNA polymerase sigma-70 factor [Niabella sp. W65]MCH7369514.1 RNA polymerase sigma-70 factor [Niabella sp. W65]ULT45047.1 RNA polymerase sigma-70 factor [Niabella sp. I65]